MKILFVSISALLVLQNVIATPVQIRSDMGMMEFTSFMANIPNQLTTTTNALMVLSTSQDPTVQGVLATFQQLASYASLFGGSVLGDFNNPYPMRGMRHLKNQTDTLFNYISAAVSVVASVDPSHADELQASYNALVSSKEAVYAVVEALAQEAKYGDPTQVRMLIQVIDDDDMAVIQGAVQQGIDLINYLTQVFVGAVQVQTRSDMGMMEFTSFMGGIPNQLSATTNALMVLSTSQDPTVQSVLAIFGQLAAYASSYGGAVLQDLNNPYPMRGMRQFKNQTDTLFNHISAVVGVVASIDPSHADELQASYNALVSSKDAVYAVVEALAQEAKYGDPTQVKMLIQVIDDNAMAVIQGAVQQGIDLINHLAEVFVGTVN